MYQGNYISNLSLENASGGWNGMNSALHRALSAEFHLNYVGPINPPAGIFSKLSSKSARLLGQPGAYHFFSDSRLKRIAHAVRSQCNNCDSNVSFDYFHGITPWISTQLSRPSFAFADACFATYFDTYHTYDRFSKHDLDRIVRREKAWLENLATVFFTSRYAINECRKRYSMCGSNFEYVGLGAGFNPATQDSYTGKHEILFIAVDFGRKGGDVCVASFLEFRKQFSDATLTIIGAQPPSEVLNLPATKWIGFLRKDVPEQLQTLQKHLASAFALVLPTVSDMTPVVVAEAGLHGCPTLAPRSFGIPEMIEDRRTGRLLPTPPNVSDFAKALIEMAQDKDGYLLMRQAVLERSAENFTWKRVAQFIKSSILRNLNVDTK